MPFKAYSENKIILFGDSLMSGYGLEKKYHLSTILKEGLNDIGLNYNVINASVAGDTTAGGLNRLNWTLSEESIKIFVLCLGANDMLRGIKLDATEKNLDNIISITLSKKIKIIFAGMLAPDSYGHVYKNHFDNIYVSLSKKYDLSYIPFLLEGVALNPDLNLDDGMHPNEKGVEIISNSILKEIKKIN